MPFLAIIGFRVMGFGLLLLSLKLSWFEVPVDIVWDNDDDPRVITLMPEVTRYFKVIMALYIGFLFGAPFVIRPSQWKNLYSRLTAAGAGALFVVLIFYPYYVMTRSPEVAGKAAWGAVQHDSLTWLGGEVYNSREYGRQEMKSAIYFKDPQQNLAPIPIPNISPTHITLSHLPPLMSMLGYNRGFEQFFNKGWMFALAGTCLIFLGQLRSMDSNGSRQGRKKMAHRYFWKLAVFTAALLLLNLSPLFVATSQIGRAYDAVSVGDYESASIWLDRFKKTIPSMQYHSAVLQQEGIIDLRLGKENTFAARNHLALSLELNGHFHQAESIFYDIVLSDDAPMPCRISAYRGILRSAIVELNEGKTSGGVEKLIFLKSMDPVNLKINYILQAAYVRLLRYEDLIRLHKEMAAIYSYFQLPDKKAVLADSHHNLAVCAFELNRPEEVLAGMKGTVSP